MNLTIANILNSFKFKPRPQDVIVETTPESILKKHLENINIHPAIGHLARRSYSLAGVYRAVKAGYLTTYGKALLSEFEATDDIYESALNIMNKSGEIQKVEYFQAMNRLRNGLDVELVRLS